MPFEDLGFAKMDHHRALRHGMPEVIFAKGKTPQQVVAIAERLLEHSPNVLITRADRECGAFVTAESAGRRVSDTFRSRALLAGPDGARQRAPSWWSAPAPATCPWPKRRRHRRNDGEQVDTINDIGVAGIHRLMHNRERLVRGASDRGVRRNGGRPAQRRGRPGLLPGDRRADQRRLWRELQRAGGAAGMLNSCASNVTVVNIDNGFGAGYVASLINRL